jgi:hypothetical protein
MVVVARGGRAGLQVALGLFVVCRQEQEERGLRLCPSWEEWNGEQLTLKQEEGEGRPGTLMYKLCPTALCSGLGGYLHLT